LNASTKNPVDLPPTNVLAVAKEADRNTQITRSSSGAAGHVTELKSVKRRAIVAAHGRTEPGAWFLVEAVKTLHQPNSTFRGARGELIKEGEWFMQVPKYEESVASTNYYVAVEDDDVGCDGGDGGLLYIPAENVVVVVMDVKVVNKRMPKDVVIKAMGEEWGDLSRRESREILSSECSYLPKAERERTWLNCPR
jgi:hypothetical protein